MNSILRTVFITFSLFCCIFQAQSQDSIPTNNTTDSAGYTVPGAEVHKVHSSIVNQLYELRVMIPGDYLSQIDKSYPVIYVLDGQWNFTIAADIAGKLAYDGMIPEVIIAAITWGGEGDDPNLLRGRDFTATPSPFIPQSGGAGNFLKALEEELIPYIESHYRTDSRRALTGSSLGGLFTSYAMLEKPNLFNGYIALAAPYSLEQSYFANRFSQIEDSDFLKGTRAYLGVGSLDFNQDQVTAFSSALDSLNLSGFKKKLKITRGVGHAGVEPIGYTLGYQFAFKRPALNLSKTFLQRYEGIYQISPDFPTITVSADRGKLILQQEGSAPLEFLAASKTTFYFLGVDYDLEFFENTEGTMSFLINVQGTQLEFKRQLPQ